MFWTNNRFRFEKSTDNVVTCSVQVLTSIVYYPTTNDYCIYLPQPKTFKLFFNTFSRQDVNINFLIIYVYIYRSPHDIFDPSTFNINIKLVLKL